MYCPIAALTAFVLPRSRLLNSGYEYLRFPVAVVFDEIQYFDGDSQKGVRPGIFMNTKM
jgi:hypothetical protein